MADLKLLHFWIMNTSLTMSARSQDYVWQNVIVELGFQHSFLLRGILACAAVHMAGFRAAETEELLTLSSAHMGIAVSALRVEIERPDPATCAPVFALACLLVVHSLGLAQVKPPSDAIGQLFHMMRLINGVQACAAPHWDRILQSEVAPIAKSIDRSLGPTESVDEVVRLKDLVRQVVQADSPIREDYLHAIDELHFAFLGVRYYTQSTEKAYEKPTVSFVMAWIALVRPAFLERLYGQDELALVILAYYAVLFRLQDSSWWMRGWAGWVLNAVRARVGERYRSWLQWPFSHVES